MSATSVLVIECDLSPGSDEPSEGRLTDSPVIVKSAASPEGDLTDSPLAVKSVPSLVV